MFETFRNSSRVQQAIHRGIQRALLAHKRAGRSIVIWRDGKVVVVPPDQINVSEQELQAPPSSIADA
ncbi:MAG: hypothetical protein H7Y88_07520 [Phycisphaerales bacterium]|nr:hypothetical protein [Phycisphaerales bacterium]